MDEFNYRREIPNEQEQWVHTPLIPRPLKLTRHTRYVACRHGIRPIATEAIVAHHCTSTHEIFCLRNKGIGMLPKWPLAL